MKAHKIFGSSKLIFILFLLIGGLTASAVTLADSTFLPLVSASEGSFLFEPGPSGSTRYGFKASKG